jgi:hypothetical protein
MVSITLDLPVLAIMTLVPLRRLKM